jgi:hypothetical protein
MKKVVLYAEVRLEYELGDAVSMDTCIADARIRLRGIGGWGGNVVECKVMNVFDETGTAIPEVKV